MLIHPLTPRHLRLRLSGFITIQEIEVRLNSLPKVSSGKDD